MNFLHTLYSSVGRLLKRLRKKEAAARGIRISEPTAPPQEHQAPRPRRQAVPGEKTLTPSTPFTPSPPPVKRKEKKTALPLKKKIDKKGFHILSDSDDLHRLFEVETDKAGHREEENFARLFEKYQTDTYQQLLLKEKTHDIHSKPPRPLTVSERLKHYPPPQAEIDLHGCTAAEAEKKTETFIRNARLRGLRTVRIIVGKGLHSQGKAVLPDLTESRILELKRHNRVLSYKWEKKDKRKSGALIVYLIPH